MVPRTSITTTFGCTLKIVEDFGHPYPGGVSEHMCTLCSHSTSVFPPTNFSECSQQKAVFISESYFSHNNNKTYKLKIKDKKITEKI